MKHRDGRRRRERNDNRAWDTLRIFQTENHDGQRRKRNGRSLPGNCASCLREGLHPVKEIARHMVHVQAEEIANLRTGNENSDSVGEAHDYRAGTLPPKRRRELEASPDFDDLMLLRQLDDAGRVPGAVVGTLDEALDYLKELERSNNG